MTNSNTNKCELHETEALIVLHNGAECAGCFVLAELKGVAREMPERLPAFWKWVAEHPVEVGVDVVEVVRATMGRLGVLKRLDDDDADL